MSAAWESLHAAARELATENNIKQRLTIAFSKHLSHLDELELPPSARSEFRSLADRMTAVSPLRGESAVAATVRKMSNIEAAECAQRIVALLAAVALAAPQTTARPRSVVSLFTADA